MSWYSVVCSSVSGVGTIRSYGAGRRITSRFLRRIITVSVSSLCSSDRLDAPKFIQTYAMPPTSACLPKPPRHQRRSKSSLSVISRLVQLVRPFLLYGCEIVESPISSSAASANICCSPRTHSSDHSSEGRFGIGVPLARIIIVVSISSDSTT